jgi:anti-anti-sigma factor
MNSDDRAKTQFNIHTYRHGDGFVVEASGNFKIENSGELSGAVESTIKSGIYRIVLDATGREFINSVGLAEIVFAHNRCRKHGGFVRLVRPQPAVRHMLEMTSLAHLFACYDSVEAALSE